MLTVGEALDRLREDGWEGWDDPGQRPSAQEPLAASPTRPRTENTACASVRAVSETPGEKTDGCGVRLLRVPCGPGG